MGIDCKTAVVYISKKEEGKLNFIQKYHLFRHLAICYICKRFEKQNREITTIFKSSASKEIDTLKQSDKEVIINALEENT